MNVSDALVARRSIRAFLDKPIPRETLNAIFEAAVRTPSWANSQPWDVFVASGDTLKRIKAAYLENYANAVPVALETPRPTQWPDAAIARQKGLHPDMIRDCGDAVEQFGKLNQTMFNAPTVIFLCLDEIFAHWGLYDVGAYSQSIMLAAIEHGLGTIPAIQVVNYPDILHRELNIPANLKVAIGIAIGYTDDSHGINNFHSSRSPLSETVRFCD